MANPIDNLRPGEYKLTLEEQKAGGRASVEARRRRKTLKEELLLLLETNEFQKRISTALLEQAEKGNVKAFEVLRDTIGEKEPDKVSIEKNTPADELLKSIEELKKK